MAKYTNKPVKKNTSRPSKKINSDRSNKEKFDEWMRKMKNVFYPDNEQMCNAYERIIEYK